MSIPMKKSEASTPPATTIEDVLIKGDLSSLTSEQRTEYYMKTCQSLGLNPMTEPFSFIVLNGKLKLYALRAAADQLRKIHGISIEIVSQELRDGLLSVHVRAKDKTGRQDEDMGVVSMGTLKGEAAANTILKAITKAKRRVTLSISGLGYLDETEIEDIPAHAKQQPKLIEEQPPRTIAQATSEAGADLPTQEQLNELIELCGKAKKSTAAMVGWLAKNVNGGIKREMPDFTLADYEAAKKQLHQIIEDMKGSA